MQPPRLSLMYNKTQAHLVNALNNWTHSNQPLQVVTSIRKCGCEGVCASLYASCVFRCSAAAHMLSTQHPFTCAIMAQQVSLSLWVALPAAQQGGLYTKSRQEMEPKLKRHHRKTDQKLSNRHGRKDRTKNNPHRKASTPADFHPKQVILD